MKQLIKHSIIFSLTFIFLLFRVAPIQAIDISPAPTPPESPTLGSFLSTPEPSQAPQPPSPPTLTKVLNNEESEDNLSQAEKSQTIKKADKAENSDIAQSGIFMDKSHAEDNGAKIETGDASASGTLTAVGNDDLNTIGNLNNTQAANINNGADSENAVLTEIEDNNLTLQKNEVKTNNELKLKTQTGENSASYNTRQNSSIITGDANTTGTIVTLLNTNASAATVSEFNVTDNQSNDLVLDFDAFCISGCDSAISAQNSHNGANSSNNILVNNLSDSTTLQTNEAEIENTLILSSDSGNNTANYNTNGNSVIQTGDANTVGNILTFANNNIAGKIIFGVVNIFGNLVGDIILPEDLLACPECQNQITAANTNNGAESQNNTAINTSDTEVVFQSNLVDIENNFVVTATTGDNQTSYNTNGNSTISTGDANASVQAINIANNNIEGDNMWLVIINKTGKWVGQILGAPEGSIFAGSSGTQVSVNPKGEITATNSGNGTGSENNTQVSSANNNTTIQENIAKIANNLFLSSNTGGNEASYNTGGNSTISTGDAKVIANLVNFINNNISGNGRLVVTVVNIFGSWIGDFVTPGNKKANTQNQGEENSQSNDNAGKLKVTSSLNQHSTQAQSSNPNLSNSLDPSNLSDNQVMNNNSNSTSPASLLKSIFTSNNPQNSPSYKQGNATLVAGEKAENSPVNILTGGAKDIKKKVSINLAWFLLLIPAIPLFYLAKRR